MMGVIPYRLSVSILGLLLVFIVLSLGACGAKDQHPGHVHSLLFNTSSKMNEGAPLKIRIALLTDNAAFMSAAYPDLQGNIHTTLAESLIETKDIFLLPVNEQIEQHLTIMPSVKYIGLFAEYKDMTQQHWRLLLPLAEAPPSSLWRQFWPAVTERQVIDVTREGLRRDNGARLTERRDGE